MIVDVSDKEAISTPKSYFSLMSQGTHWTGRWVGFRDGVDTDLKAKAVAQHATQALAGRGGTAANHSRPPHYMEVKGQRHAAADLWTWWKDPRYPLYRRLGVLQGWVCFRTGLDTETRRKIICLWWASNTCRPVYSRHYTVWATNASSIFSNTLFCSKQGLWRLRILRGIQSIVAMSPNVRRLQAVCL
jgi:hypothetical protein